MTQIRTASRKRTVAQRTRHILYLSRKPSGTLIRMEQKVVRMIDAARDMGDRVRFSRLNREWADIHAALEMKTVERPRKRGKTAHARHEARESPAYERREHRHGRRKR